MAKLFVQSGPPRPGHELNRVNEEERYLLHFQRNSETNDISFKSPNLELFESKDFFFLCTFFKKGKRYTGHLEWLNPISLKPGPGRPGLNGEFCQNEINLVKCFSIGDFAS